MQDDWTVVVPPKGQVKETAQALLKLARSPQDVRTIGTGGEFRVPQYLADLYNTPAPAPAPAPTPRRRTKKEGDE